MEEFMLFLFGKKSISNECILFIDLILVVLTNFKQLS